MTDRTTDTTDTKPQARPLSSRRMLGQLSVFLLGFLSLLALHGVFTYLKHELDEQTANERARLFVGEQVAGDIRLVESGVYRMATTLGVRAQQRVAQSIREAIQGIRYNLGVLRDGGVARQTIRLNLEKQNLMIKEVPYDPAMQAKQGYILEIIDLTPKLLEIEDKISELAKMLEQREVLRKADNREGLFRLEREIKVFLKKLPPLFTRLAENANRMFFDSHRRQEQIEARIEEQTRRYLTMELAMVVGIIVSVMLLGLKFARQIERGNTQLADARDHMREAKEEAERANRAKSEFLSRMSHELRTPLNAVLGFSQLLAIDPQLTGEQRDSLEEIDKAGRHLLELINEILDLAKIESGRLELERIEYSIPELAEDVVGIMAARAHDKGLELHAFISPRLPEISMGDPTRVRQVLLNLLGNAVKFTERGEVGLRIEPDADRGVMRFEVTDTGIGFDEGGRQKLFQPFTQADESTTRRFGGSGLGLVICKELLGAMGGHIDSESVPGEGSRFWFELPLDELPQSAMPVDDELADLPVLVVEDRPVVAGILEAYLTALAARPTVVADKEAALSALRRARSAGDPYRVLLADADLDGFGARRLIQDLEAEMRNDALQPTPVLLVSGGKMPEDPALAGYREILGKPVTMQKLGNLLREYQGTPEPVLPDAPVPPMEDSADGAVRILLVEDQLPNQMVARSMLQRLGARVECVDNGRAAVDSALQGGYDLIFMDMQMPVMDGVEATRLIRGHESDQAVKRTPVVAMTANAMENDRETCLQAGMDDHLSKPISLERVDEMLRRWVPGYPPEE